MTLSPILAAPLAVQLHLVAALMSLLLAPPMLMLRKGNRLHKRLGRIWILAMALTALSSFAITEIRLIGPYSPIHLLSIVTLVCLALAVNAARAGRIDAHKRFILGALAGLVGAGGFTLLPGRLLSKSLFEGFEIAGFSSVLAVTVFAVVWVLRYRKTAAF